MESFSRTILLSFFKTNQCYNWNKFSLLEIKAWCCTLVILPPCGSKSDYSCWRWQNSSWVLMAQNSTMKYHKYSSQRIKRKKDQNIFLTPVLSMSCDHVSPPRAVPRCDGVCVNRWVICPRTPMGLRGWLTWFFWQCEPSFIVQSLQSGSEV